MKENLMEILNASVSLKSYEMYGEYYCDDEFDDEDEEYDEHHRYINELRNDYYNNLGV